MVCAAGLARPALANADLPAASQADRTATESVAPAARRITPRDDARDAGLQYAGMRVPLVDTLDTVGNASAATRFGVALLVLVFAVALWRRQRATRAQVDLLQAAVAQRTAALQEQHCKSEAALRDLQRQRDEAVRLAAASLQRAGFPAQQWPACSGGKTSGPVAQPPRILVADADADLRGRLRELLAPHYDVSEAADGDAALRCARIVQPDLVISDVLMPKCNGFDLVRAFRADPRLRDVPLILLTARADSADEIRALDAGADRFLHKPLDAGVLMAHLRTTLRTVSRRETGTAAALAAEPDNEAGTIETASLFDPFVTRVTVWLETHLHEEDVDMDALAAAVHVSRATLYRRYAMAAGESPASALHRLRLDRASALLVGGERSISEIARAVGFRSLSAFSHAWRKRHGDAPTRRSRKRIDDEAERTDA